MRASLQEIEDDKTWDNSNQFILEEIAWSEKMKVKVQNL